MRLLDNDAPFSILDWFGSPRNKYTFGHKNLTWYLGPSNPIAGDAARGFVRDSIPERFEAFLIQDVYETPDGPLSPDHLRHLCNLASQKTGYVIARSFFGMAGHDSDLYAEGAWIRNEQGLIEFSSDPKSTPYSPHHDINWIFENRSIDGISIADVGHEGPYSIFKIALEAPDAVPLLQGTATEGVIECRQVEIRQETFFTWLEDLIPLPTFMDTHCKTLTQWCGIGPKRVNTLVHLPTFMERNFLFRNKPVSGALYDTVKAAVINTFTTTPLCQTLAKRFPKFYARLAQETATAIIYYDRHVEVASMQALYGAFFDSNSKLLEIRTNKAQPVQDKTSWILGVVLAVTVTASWMFKRRLVRTITGSFIPEEMTLAIGEWCSSHLTSTNVVSALTNFGTKLSDRFVLGDSVLNGYSNLLANPTRLWTQEYDGWMPREIRGLAPVGAKIFTSLYVCMGAPIFEEWLRDTYPRWSFWYNTIYEPFEKYMAGGGVLGAVYSFAFHTLFSRWAKNGMSRKTRIAIHSFHNFAVLQCTDPAELPPVDFSQSMPWWMVPLTLLLIGVGTVISDYMAVDPAQVIIRDRLEKKNTELAEGLYPLWKGTKYPSTTGEYFPENFRPSVEKSLRVKMDGRDIDFELFKDIASCNSLNEYNHERLGIYPILAPVNLMHRPSTSLKNLLIALTTRVFNNPYPEITTKQEWELEEAKRLVLWQNLISRRLQVYPTMYQDRYTFAQALEKMPTAKRLRLQTAQDNLVAYGLYHQTKSVSVKHDELLAVKNNNIKIRAITQFPPEYLALNTTYCHSLADVLHELYSPDVEYIVFNLNPTLPPVIVTWVFASGFTQEQLSNLGQQMKDNQDKVIYVVAGDDCVVSWGPLSKYYGKFGEGDFTAYDHTQGKGPMYADVVKFEHMGIPAEFTKRKDEGTKSPITVRGKTKTFSFKIQADAGIQMPTGDGCTTNVNSGHNIDVGHGYVEEAGSGRTISEIAYSYGFVVKWVSHEDFGQCTFLKGWWVQSSVGQLWLPLPSLVLKNGKLLTDPLVVAKTKNYDQAYKICAYALATSTGNIPRSYPIAGVFLDKLKRLGIANNLTLGTRYKAQCDMEADLNVDSINTQIFERYGIHQEEIQIFENLVEQVNELPTVISHPIYNKLGLDYGMPVGALLGAAELVYFLLEKTYAYLMTETIAKAESKITNLVEKVGGSEDGQLWVKEVCDPFSDTPRRPVGFPDLITGNSVVQVIKQSKTFTFPTASDAHIFLDTVDTEVDMYINNRVAGYGNNTMVVTAAPGVNTHKRGGLIVRSAAVGTPLVASTTTGQIALPRSYTTGGATRVLAKAFEVHNTTNKLNVGGAVTVYRETGGTPYGHNSTCQTYATAWTFPLAAAHAELSDFPTTSATATSIPGSQQWDAEKGCYVVAIMSAQTNNPTEEKSSVIFTGTDSALSGTQRYCNVVAGAASNPPVIANAGAEQLVSPFFGCGAYFSGLPAGTELTVNTIHYIERFVDASNLDLVVLAQPSPYYDAAALELYSKTASRLPHGVKAGDNADGDWIKNIADVLSTFGVPGMPFVKGAVDLWNNLPGSESKRPKQQAKKPMISAEQRKHNAAANAFADKEMKRILQLERQVAQMDRVGAIVGSPSKSLRPMNNQRPQRGGRKPARKPYVVRDRLPGQR